jgi:hypothetical protein
VILALDIATRMGWALGAPGEVPTSGSALFGSDGASNPARFHHALRWAIGRFRDDGGQIERIAIEDQLDPRAFSHVQGAKLLYGYPAIIISIAYECGYCNIVEHAVRDVRGLFVNRRNLKTDAAKAAVMRRCAQLGWQVEDHNAADACALWAYECWAYERSQRRPPAIIHQLARCGL